MGLLGRLLLALPMPNYYRQYLRDTWKPKSFSQLGEDSVIANQLTALGLNLEAPGFYLDIGAFHPTLGSNTYTFYRRGGAGVCIDVGNDKRKAFARIRPRDTFVEAAIVPADWPFDTVSFSLESTDHYGSQLGHVEEPGASQGGRSLGSIECRALRANEVLAIAHGADAFQNAAWKVLNLDIEGFDFEVLRDLDVTDFGFDVIAIEELYEPQTGDRGKLDYLLHSSRTVEYLRSVGYSLESVCGVTLIFARTPQEVG